MQPKAPASRNDDRQHAILDAALDAVIEMGEDGLIRYWNPQAHALFGWTAGEAVGQPLAELIIPERHRDRRGLERFLDTGQGPILGRRWRSWPTCATSRSTGARRAPCAPTSGRFRALMGVDE